MGSSLAGIMESVTFYILQWWLLLNLNNNIRWRISRREKKEIIIIIMHTREREHRF